jgi:hypothetical protein
LIAYGSAPIRLNRFALGAALVLFTLLHLLRFFTITLRNGSFAWSSDESLLVPDSAGTLVTLRCLYGVVWPATQRRLLHGAEHSLKPIGSAFPARTLRWLGT